MKIKTRDLAGRALDWTVATCKGATEEWRGGGPFFWRGAPCVRVGGHDVDYSPSTDWAAGGPIIEREDIDTGRNLAHSNVVRDEFIASLSRCKTHPTRDVRWYATMPGPNRLVAAMRCYVASKLGEEVDIPDALLTKEAS